MALRVKPDHLMARILDNEATKKIFGTDTTIYGVRTGRTAFERAAESIKEVVDQIYLLYNNKIADNAVAVSIYKRSLKITSPRRIALSMLSPSQIAGKWFLIIFCRSCPGYSFRFSCISFIIPFLSYKIWMLRIVASRPNG